MRITASKRELIFFGGLGAVALFFYYSGYVYPFQNAAFDQAAWHTRTGGLCYRGGMVADLRENQLKNGMPKSEVEALLGETHLSHWMKYKGCLSYDLGTCTGGDPNLNGDYLLICFDENDRMTRSDLHHYSD